MFLLLIILIFFQIINGIKIINEFVEEPEDIETIIGSTIIFRCRTQSIYQNQVTWCKNDFCTLGKTRDLTFYPRYQIIGDINQGEHHFKIVNVSLEDMGIYQCQILAGPRRSPSMSRKAKLTVLQIPTSISIDNPIILVENALSYIVCRANNAMPEATLSWILPKSINYLSKIDYVILSEQSLRNSISNITLIANRSYHGLIIQCQAHSSAIQILNKTIIAQQIIETIFLPEIKLNLIGEQIENNLIYIDCNIESRPNLIEIEWFNGSYLLNVTHENRLSLFLTRYMNKNQIICQVKNQVGKQNQSIVLDIIYKPIFIDKNGKRLKNYSVELVDEGQSIELECYVDSSPLSLITWIYNSNEILSINKTSIQINNIQSNKNVGNYVCSVYHYRFGIFNRTIRIALKDSPEIIEEKTIKSVYIGQTTLFVCSVSKDIPIQEIFWSREDEVKINLNEKYEIIENKSDNLIKSKLIIKNVEISDNGYYICVVRNQYGSSINKYQLKVNYFKYYFLFYGSIFIGILISFILIIFPFIYYYKQKKSQRIRRKSSTTNETISSFAKQQDNNQYDYQDETNCFFQQNLVEQKLINYQKYNVFDSNENDFIYLKENPKSYSTVV